jgi:hypothetical protein
VLDPDSFLPLNISSQQGRMLSMVWVPYAREQNGVLDPTELSHIREHLVTQITVSRIVWHHRAWRVQTLQMLRPVTGVADKHMSKAGLYRYKE